VDAAHDLDTPIAPAELPQEDDAASERTPDEIAGELASLHLDVYDGDRRLGIEELAKAMLSAGLTDTIPPHFSRTPTVDRLLVVDEHWRGVDDTGGRWYRPEWARLTYRPTLADLVMPRTLRASHGGHVWPLVDEAIFGADDRQPFIPDGWPWTCVGTLTCTVPGKKPMSGTATLVGVRTIATAAHLIPDEAWDGRNWSGQFAAAWYCSSSLAGPGATSFVTGGYGYQDHEAGNDMVVLRLEKPLGSWIGYFGYRTYDDDWEDKAWWTHVGYPGALGQGDYPYRQGPISIFDDDSGPDDSLELQHYGDMGDGDSGGPLFGWWPKGPYLIGVMSGNYRRSGTVLGIADYNHNVHAGGEALSRLCAYGRANWP
jgi:V8-like Glu-specific endopeptidase